MSEREKRLALNEALFREMNERVEERLPRSDDDARFEIVCECGDLECADRITLTREEYEQTHADSAQFTVTPGHAADDVEWIVERNERFHVVRKEGLAGDVAEALDDP